MEKGFHVEIPPIPNIPPIPPMDFEAPNIGVVYVHSSARSGLMVENLTQQLGEFFGAKNGSGVLVRSVEKGSRADKAGLRAGDVITRVGDQPVHDTSDFTHALHDRTAGSVNVNVIRDKKEQTLTLSLPARKESGAVIRESLEIPELDAETEIDISEVQDEIAKLRPELELAREEAHKASAEVRNSLGDQEKALKEQAEKIRQEFTPQVREELEKSRQILKQQMERLRQEMRGSWLDI